MRADFMAGFFCGPFSDNVTFVHPIFCSSADMTKVIKPIVTLQASICHVMNFCTNLWSSTIIIIGQKNTFLFLLHIKHKVCSTRRTLATTIITRVF
jgi:hypothetical protein